MLRWQSATSDDWQALVVYALPEPDPDSNDLATVVLFAQPRIAENRVCLVNSLQAMSRLHS